VQSRAKAHIAVIVRFITRVFFPGDKNHAQQGQ
jgi:hypothetical protein